MIFSNDSFGWFARCQSMEEKLEVSADAKKEFRLATSLRNGTKTFFAPRHLFFVVVQVVAGMYGWHYWHYLPAPGFAIGIAALLAAVMAVHLDMRVLHRAIWILLVGAFVVIDLQAITKDRDDNTKDRKATADAFSSLVTLQNKALTSNQINFENALGRLENLTNQQTGGNSIPIIYNTDPKVDEKGGLTLEISLQGKYPLSPLHVSIFPHLQDVKSGKT